MSTSKKNRSAFPDILSDLIRDSGKKLREIARESGIGASQLSAYQSGTNEPNMSTLVKLSDYFNVPVDYLVGRTIAPTRDIKIGSVCDFTGLTVKSAKFVSEQSKRNSTHWRMDAINFLLEHDAFSSLLDMLIGYATAGDHEIPYKPASNGLAPVITDRDIFRAKINDLISLIVSDSKAAFAPKVDYRHLYRLYFASYLKYGHTLEEIKCDMEKQGLIFDKKLFDKGDE